MLVYQRVYYLGGDYELTQDWESVFNQYFMRKQAIFHGSCGASMVEFFPGSP